MARSGLIRSASKDFLPVVASWIASLAKPLLAAAPKLRYILSATKVPSI